MQPNQDPAPSDEELMDRLVSPRSETERGWAAMALVRRHYVDMVLHAEQCLLRRRFRGDLANTAENCVQEAISKVLLGGAIYDGKWTVRIWLLLLVRDQVSRWWRRLRG